MAVAREFCSSSCSGGTVNGHNKLAVAELLFVISHCWDLALDTGRCRCFDSTCWKIFHSTVKMGPTPGS